MFRNLSLGLLVFILSACTQKHGTECTEEPRENWKDQESFKQDLLGQGYKINVFKVTKGNCYEIYGWNKEGEKVEIYFNPVDGSIVKEEIED